MSDFLDITSIEVPYSAANEANLHLREMGKRGMEGFSLWAGRREETKFKVLHNIVPSQTGHSGPDGVCISVGPEELHRLNVWLFQNNMTLVAQLHSHPTDAYHSDLDDTFPIATTLGSLSIVVPNYARAPFDLMNCAVYRLIPNGGWRFIEPRDVTRLICVGPT